VYVNQLFDVCGNIVAHTAGLVIALNNGNLVRCRHTNERTLTLISTGIMHVDVTLPNIYIHLCRISHVSSRCKMDYFQNKFSEHLFATVFPNLNEFKIRMKLSDSTNDKCFLPVVDLHLKKKLSQRVFQKETF